jgi:SAM-dependent methyltransferase
LLQVVTTVGTNHGFLDRTFRALARTREHRRVLIAGTADYAMLARVKAAYDAETQPLDVTALDLCETPLWLNRWYADRFGFTLNTVCADALAFATTDPFDLICTHNFLGRFDDEERRRLVARWHALLRPGGAVVTTLRIRPQSQQQRVTYDAARARTFAARVSACAQAWPATLDVTPDELAAAAYEYAVRKNSYSISSNEMVTALFEREGFDIVLADQGGGREERERDRPASTAGIDTYRMRLIARKRFGTTTSAD